LSFFACRQNQESVVPETNVMAKDTSVVPLDTAAYRWEDDKIVINWEDLLDIRFEKRQHEMLDSVDIPVFNDKVKAINGQHVIIEGFYIPVEETGDENIVILSAYPFAECFFCGQAGVESIVDVLIKEKLPPIKTDTKVRFSGKFRLNPDNFDFLIYILDDARYLGNTNEK
jgi:hypothetical protein